MTTAGTTAKTCALSILCAIGAITAVVLWAPASFQKPPLVPRAGAALQQPALLLHISRPTHDMAPAPKPPVVRVNRARQAPPRAPSARLLEGRAFSSVAAAPTVIASRVPATAPESSGIGSAFAQTGRTIGTSFRKTGARVAAVFTR